MTEEPLNMELSDQATESPLRNSASELSSPSNTSTEAKKVQENGNRRTSLRTKVRPTYFDASPIISSASRSSSTSVTPNPTPRNGKNSRVSKSGTTVVDESQDDDLESEDGIVFKKPATVSRKRPTKTALNVTVKKGKSVNKSTSNQPLNLYDIVKDGKSAMMSVINDWIESYTNDKMAAMTDLIQFFVNSSGCNAKVTKFMVESEDTVRAIRHLTENFGEQAEEYPLIIARPEFRKFKGNFISFILQLINLSQHSVIYDDEMMDALICWITGMSDSQVRAFRHTSTLAAMKIVTGLIDVALKVGIEMDHTQRQLDLENLKTANKKSREKVEKLKNKRDELRQNKCELEEMMNRVFSSIFIHRYRDSRHEIRAICIAEIGQWLNNYSTYFLNQNYLKYLGWMLYDKVGSVRLQVLIALEELYSNEDFLEKLELFTGRFRDRMINMTLDVDGEVAVKAIKLACLLYKYDALEEDDCSQVEQLVFCDQRGMAHAAGEFFSMRIVRLSLEASPKKLKKGHKDDYLRQLNIKAIIEFVIKTEVHDHCTYIVDSIWEHSDLLKDWKTMTNLLLDRDSLIDLDDQQEEYLINLMTCAVKQAATAIAPPGRTQNKKQSQKEKKTLQDDRINISTHFMEVLPDLVEKYKADVPKVRELLKIPEYFDLELYAEKRLTKHLETLLAHMEDVLLKHSDKELLDTCSMTYFYLKDNELGIQQTVEHSLNRSLSVLAEKFQGSTKQGIPTPTKKKQSKAHFNIVTGLKRIAAFSKHHNMSEWSVYEDVHAIIDQGMNSSVDDEVLILSIQAMLQFCLQDLISLDTEKPNKGDLKKLRKKLKTFIKQLDELLQFSNSNVKSETFKILCDLFFFFPKQTLNDNSQFDAIVMTAETSLQVRMRDFVMDHVFNSISEEEENENLEEDQEEDDNKTRELHDKRMLLAGLCKLIGYQIFDFKLAAPIFAQLIRGYPDYGDIIKALMNKSRENNFINFSKVLLFGLQQSYKSLCEDGDGEIDTRSKEFIKIKDLAHRFALQCRVNINQYEVRKSTITIHREGIKYALSPEANALSTEEQVVPDVPPNLLFFEILREFSYRVTNIDRKAVLQFLEEKAGSLLNREGIAWSPLRNYKLELEKTVIRETTKIVDEADIELAEEMALEKQQKKEAPSKKKAQKKLSLSKVSMSGNENILSKMTIAEEDEKIEEEIEPPTKVARAIPKIIKSVDTETALEEGEEEDQSDIESDIDTNASSEIPPNTNASSTASKQNTGKRGSVAASPIRLSTEKDGSIEEDLGTSDINSTITDDTVASDVTSQKSWLASQPHGSVKKPTQSYGGRNNTKRKNVEDSSQDSGSDVSSSPSSSAREMRATKRRKQEDSE